MEQYPTTGITFGSQEDANRNRDNVLNRNEYLSARHYHCNDIILFQFGERIQRFLLTRASNDRRYKI